jgi:hypothetical protein
MSRTIRTQGNYMTHRGGSRVAGFALPSDRQLFLAAPDLLAALRGLLAVRDAVKIEREEDYEGHPYVGDVWASAEAAIQKATEEETA